MQIRDVAQLVARLLWEQDVAGSNPVIPTNKTKFDLVSSLVLFFIAKSMVIIRLDFNYIVWYNLAKI